MTAKLLRMPMPKVFVYMQFEMYRNGDFYSVPELGISDANYWDARRAIRNEWRKRVAEARGETVTP